jgi:hypothetical protein
LPGIRTDTTLKELWTEDGPESLDNRQ